MKPKDKNPGIITDPDILSAYNEDALGLRGSFEGVVRPADEQEIIDFVHSCRASRKPVTAQGLRSSLTGAALCDQGYALSLEKMNRIIDIDKKRRTAVLEPGVITADLRKAAAEAGLYYPPDPTSVEECTMGGNVATNASGSCTLKYGRTGDWIKRLRVVDGNGRRIEAKGQGAEKQCAGYGAMYQPARLFLGSEGTLGIITEIEVALTLPPPYAFLAMVFLPDLQRTFDFVRSVREDRTFSPTGLEFFDEACLDILRPIAEGIAIPQEARFMIFFEQEYNDDKEKDVFLEKWLSLIKRISTFADDTQIALSDKQKSHLRALRHHVPQQMNEEGSRAVKNGGGKISTDWAVPWFNLPELFAHYDKINHLLGDMKVVRFGHLGEGHPHFNFIARNLEETRAAENVDFLMAKKAVELGGTIAGEHGIGKLKREHLVLEYSPPLQEAMKAIKYSFDPLGILAPGNIFN